MTDAYRDDEEAALARAEALERERDELQDQVEQLRDEVSRLRAGVGSEPVALTKTELGDLLDQLAFGKTASPKAVRTVGVVAVTFIGAALVAFVCGVVAVGALLALTGTLVLLLAFAAFGPQKPDEIIAAVRERPDEVAKIRELADENGDRIITISTATASADFRTATPEQLVPLLGRRCPRAVSR